MPYLHAISLTQALLGQERLFKSKNIHIQLSPCLLCACSCSVVKNECRDCECKTWYPGVDGAMHPCLDYPILKMRLSKTSCLKKKTFSLLLDVRWNLQVYIYILIQFMFPPNSRWQARRSVWCPGALRTEYARLGSLWGATGRLETSEPL